MNAIIKGFGQQQEVIEKREVSQPRRAGIELVWRILFLLDDEDIDD